MFARVHDDNENKGASLDAMDFARKESREGEQGNVSGGWKSREVYSREGENLKLACCDGRVGVARVISREGGGCSRELDSCEDWEGGGWKGNLARMTSRER